MHSLFIFCLFLSKRTLIRNVLDEKLPASSLEENPSSSTRNIWHFKRMRHVRVSLPRSAWLTLRWRQEKHSGTSNDRWMLDNIVLTAAGVFFWLL